ncbi:MAG: hypothetical protein WCD28_11320 [Nitrososphaeraceae archaeon]
MTADHTIKLHNAPAVTAPKKEWESYIHSLGPKEAEALYIKLRNITYVSDELRTMIQDMVDEVDIAYHKAAICINIFHDVIKKGSYPEDEVLEIVKKHLEGGQYIDHQHMDRIWKYGLEQKSKKRNEGTRKPRKKQRTKR